MIRFLHLSDIHFGSEHETAVQAAAEFVRDHPADLTILSGDITQMGLQVEFAQAAVWVAALPGRKLIVPGNHDTPYAGLYDRLTRPFQRFEAAWGPSDGAEARGDGFLVCSLNTARGAQLRLNWSKGAVSAGQIRDAAARLSLAAPGVLRVLVAHHPLVEVTGGPMTGRVRGGARAASVLSAVRTDLVLTGHLHVPFAHALTPNDGKTYGVGAGTLSTRLRGAPPGFNLIEADEATIKVTALGWTGARFEPQKTWGLPRRRR
jgi:3',5'-cyclic AMP phosphodiesterase CpdA